MHGRYKKSIEFWFTNLLGKGHLEEIGVDGRRICKWMLKGRLWI
jgi:hypothetical protein